MSTPLTSGSGYARDPSPVTGDFLPQRLHNFLSTGSPTGYEILTYRAEAASLYRILSRWATRDANEAASLAVVKALVPAEVIAEFAIETQKPEEEIVTDLAQLLPTAVRHMAVALCRDTHARRRLG